MKLLAFKIIKGKKMRSIRAFDETREISLEMNVMRHPEGSCLVKFGNTHVLCAASIEENVPSFMRFQGKGWVTAEYSMLPRSTHTRMRRDSSGSRPNGRTLEIQRLISRALRASMDLKLLGERQITIDCDVIQADGGTRCAAITGGFVALSVACQKLIRQGIIKKNPIKHQIAAVSCGVVGKNVLIDLDYEEDSKAMVDANFVLTSDEKIIEIQSAAEGDPFSEEQFTEMLKMAKFAIKEITDMQRQALND